MNALKYTLLYEQCANQPEREVRDMIGSIDSLLENPLCRVNVSGILPRGENVTIERHHSSDHTLTGEECVDDDSKMLVLTGMETTCTEVAASDIGCGLVGMPEACECSTSSPIVRFD